MEKSITLLGCYCKGEWARCLFYRNFHYKKMQKIIKRVLNVLENEKFLPDPEVFCSCYSEGGAPQR